MAFVSSTTVNTTARNTEQTGPRTRRGGALSASGKFRSCFVSDPKFYKLLQELAARGDISAAAKIVKTIIVDHIGNNDDAWPGIRTLARETGLSRPTVIKAISDLESKGLLIIDRRENGQVNHYRLPGKSGQESLPVKEVDRSSPFTTTGQETCPEAVKPFDHNHRDPLTNPCIYPQNSDELRLANLLFECIRERKKDFRQPNLAAWAKQIEYLVRLDHRKPERIEQVIRWVQQDAGNGGNWRGWQSVILSASKLRDKFDQLELQMEKGKGKAKPSRDFSEEESKVGTVISNES
jgi:DNA-binding MarR family transcriptional regulator